MSVAHLAVDLGASSGRAIVGVIGGAKSGVQLEEVHRFDHKSCPTPTGPVWDLTGIYQNILAGLSKAGVWCRENQVELKSVGVDTWGVDWALIGQSGELLALPHCYRDPQNNEACERVLKQLGGFPRLYERTGIQLMPLNTIFQIAARYESEPRLFDAAERLLFLPDLFHYWLCGEMATERTIASTSSMLCVESGNWDQELLEQLSLPPHILGAIVEPGTVLGLLRSEIVETTGAAAEIAVVAPASHDTASAVAAVPANGESGWAYLSSGTWSLLGAELAAPNNTPAAREVPFTNERGVDGTIRFLKNIAGLWLVQELRREFQHAGENCTFAQLASMAEREEFGRTIVDPNQAEFTAPGNMAEKLKRFARNTNQPEPHSMGQLVRCCFESLALSYAATVDQLELVLDRQIDVLHIVGGGSQNELLNQMTGGAVERTVLAGPAEATAMGNVLVQAIGCGEIANLSELRSVVRQSLPPRDIAPANPGRWQELRSKYNEIVYSQN